MTLVNTGEQRKTVFLCETLHFEQTGSGFVNDLHLILVPPRSFSSEWDGRRELLAMAAMNECTENLTWNL